MALSDSCDQARKHRLTSSRLPPRYQTLRDHSSLSATLALHVGHEGSLLASRSRLPGFPRGSKYMASHLSTDPLRPPHLPRQPVSKPLLPSRRASKTPHTTRRPLWRTKLPHAHHPDVHELSPRARMELSRLLCLPSGNWSLSHANALFPREATARLRRRSTSSLPLRPSMQKTRYLHWLRNHHPSPQHQTSQSQDSRPSIQDETIRSRCRTAYLLASPSRKHASKHRQTIYPRRLL